MCVRVCIRIAVSCRSSYTSGCSERGGRYNELLLAGLAVAMPVSPGRRAALLEAQDDAATRRFAEASAAGLSVTRVFAAGGDYQNIVLQPFPGGCPSKCICCPGLACHLNHLGPLVVCGACDWLYS